MQESQANYYLILLNSRNFVLKFIMPLYNYLMDYPPTYHHRNHLYVMVKFYHIIIPTFSFYVSNQHGLFLKVMVDLPGVFNDELCLFKVD